MTKRFGLALLLMVLGELALIVLLALETLFLEYRLSQANQEAERLEEITGELDRRLVACEEGKSATRPRKQSVHPRKQPAHGYPKFAWGR